MEKVVISELKEKDYVGVDHIDRLSQQQNLGEKWEMMSEEEKLEHLVSRKPDFLEYVKEGYSFMAKLNGEIVGFLLAAREFPKLKNLKVEYTAVDPAYQGQGIGLELYKALIAKAKERKVRKITAFINLDNPPSMKLHLKAGFQLQDRKEAVLKIN